MTTKVNAVLSSRLPVSTIDRFAAVNVCPPSSFSAHKIFSQKVKVKVIAIAMGRSYTRAPPVWPTHNT